MMPEATEERFTSGRFTSRQVEAVIAAALKGMDSAHFLSGLEGTGPIGKIEEKMAAHLGVRHTLALSSGTAALHAALLALNIGPGDEIIVTPYSWGQSVAPVLFCGATAVFADIDKNTLCLDPVSVKKRITSKTKAILPVHLFGGMADMYSLTEIAQEHGLTLIADAAHAMGASLDGRSPAQWGDAACFSLGRGKLVSGGEGGILATNDSSIYNRALVMTQHPSRAIRDLGPHHTASGMRDLGYNYRMHPLAAVLALADLEIMEMRLKHRQTVWQNFHNGLGDIPGLSAPGITEGITPSAYGIPLRYHADKNNSLLLSRQELTMAAQEAGIPLRCGPVGEPLHYRLNTAMSGANQVQPHPTHEPGSCPVAEHHCKNHEIWALSALDMDGISAQESTALGETLRCILSHQTIEHV